MLKSVNSKIKKSITINVAIFLQKKTSPGKQGGRRVCEMNFYQLVYYTFNLTFEIPISSYLFLILYFIMTIAGDCRAIPRGYLPFPHD